MKTNKIFKYRLYPTKEQSTRLGNWLSTSRFLWNLGLEQKFAGLSRERGKQVHTTAANQQREYTELRKQNDWIKDLPRHVGADVFTRLEQAFKVWYKGSKSRPRWKSIKRPILSVTETACVQFAVNTDSVKFPKLGNITAVIHRPVQGKPKTCSIKKDGDQWFALVCCEIEVNDPPFRREPKIALDCGITNFIGDSDGNLVSNPKFLDRSLMHLARLQRKMNRKVNGSRNRKKSACKLNRAYRKVRRQRDHFLHVLSHQIAKSHGTVVVEDLNIQGMIRNRSLSRQIGQVGWYKFQKYLDYKLDISGGKLVKVSAVYSSQTCSFCGHIDKASRQESLFKCTGCGYQDHADLNAPKVLLIRASRPDLTVEGSLLEEPLRSSKETTGPSW